MGSTRTIGLLATDGTLSSGVFQSYLSDAGLSVMAPSEKDQRGIVMPLIYDRASSETSPTTPRRSSTSHGECTRTGAMR